MHNSIESITLTSGSEGNHVWVAVSNLGAIFKEVVDDDVVATLPAPVAGS